MDLSLAIAQGFHNAPRLYGDSTVRTSPRISGMHSGLRAAGEEFTFGVYGGVTGLFLHPYKGARNHGPLGFVQGVGKGLGGFVLKDLAAVIGPFAYTMKGVHKELIKGRQPTAFIRRARMIQGGEDARSMDGMRKQRESDRVDAAWRTVNEINTEDEAQKNEGVKGRVAVLRDQKKLERKGGYESVGYAKKALQNKQEDRREREIVGLARSSAEEGHGGLLGKRGSLLHNAVRRSMESSSKRSDDEKAKGANQHVNGKALDSSNGSEVNSGVEQSQKTTNR